jgi:N utilization substance protein A
MFILKDITRAIDQIAQEKGLDPQRVLEAIESSIAAAYKKEYGSRGEMVKAKFDLVSGDLKFWQVKTVVDESTVRMIEEDSAIETVETNEAQSAGRRGKKGEAESRPSAKPEVRGESEEPLLPRYNSERHILIAEAKKIKKDAALGDELEFPLETHDDFGRIAAQTAKQVVLQKLREAERDSMIKEFKDKEGELVSGTVQRFDRGSVYVDLGRAIGVMFGSESIPSEHYRIGERLRFYVVAVQDDAKLPAIVLSRSHPKFVAKLFEMEVPEIADGIVEIKAMAREAGSRTKIAVSSSVPSIDPVGSCVGQRGTRVMAVNNEIGQEKIDIIEWAEDSEKFVANSISPAKVTSTELLPRREIRVYVPEDQLSLAIGRGGQNVRLAARLTGWKIDVRSQSRPDEVLSGGVADLAEGEAKKVSASDEPEVEGGEKAPTPVEDEVGVPTAKRVGKAKEVSDDKSSDK